MIVWLFLPGSQRRAFPVENELCVSCRRLKTWPRAQRSAAFEHEMWIVDWPEDEGPARCGMSPAVSRCRAVRGARQLGAVFPWLPEYVGAGWPPPPEPLLSAPAGYCVWGVVWHGSHQSHHLPVRSRPSGGGWSGLDILIESGSMISSK